MGDEQYPRRLKMDPAEFKTRGQLAADSKNENKGAGKAYGCYAYGCPLPGSINLGHGGYVCECHAFTMLPEWNGVTLRLNNMLPLLREIHHCAIQSVYSAAVMLHIGQMMNDLGYPELIPKTVKVSHSFPQSDRSTLRLEAEREEMEFPRLWIRRAREFVFREATYPQKPIPVLP